MEDKCKYCKKEMVGNPQYILRVLTSTGYKDFDFCDKKCLMEFLNRKNFLQKLFKQ